MPFQPAPGVAEVRLGLTGYGQKMQNIFHVKSTESWSLEFLENLGQAVLTWWEDEIAPLTSDQVTLDYIKLRDLTTEFAAYHEITPVTGNVGTRTSPALPFNVTAVVSWLTGLTGRSTRGRTYHIGLTEDAIEGNSLTATIQTQMVSAYNELRNILPQIDTAWNLAVLSRVQNGQPLAEAIAYEITTQAVDNFVDSQRRRLTGRGQ